MKLQYDIKAIREDIPIRDVIEMYTGQVIKNDRQVKCPAPDHPDKNPSANILKKSNICYCHACAKKFDVFDVVMENLGMSFPEACEELLNTFHLPLEHYSNIEEIRALEAAKDKGEYVAPFPVSIKDLKYLGLPTGNTVPNPEYDVELIVVKNSNHDVVDVMDWYPEHGDKFKHGVSWVDANGEIVRNYEEGEKKILPPLPLDCYEVVKQGELYDLEPTMKIHGLQELWKDKEQRGFVEDVLLQACDKMQNYLEDYQNYIIEKTYDAFGGKEGYDRAFKLNANYNKLISEGKKVTLSPEQKETIHKLQVLQHAAAVDMDGIMEEMASLTSLKNQILDLREKRLEHEGRPAEKEQPSKRPQRQPVRAWAER